MATSPTVDGSNPYVKGTAFSGRMVVTPEEGRLLMLIGMAKGETGNFLLENKNLEVRAWPLDLPESCPRRDSVGGHTTAVDL